MSSTTQTGNSSRLAIYVLVLKHLTAAVFIFIIMVVVVVVLVTVVAVAEQGWQRQWW
jgi:hypothetical protein